MGGNLTAAIIAFGVMIFVHELGHFLLAKRVGVTVHAFALGFGPMLIGIRRGETLFAVNLIPFGGYVKLAGEDLDEGGGPGAFRSKTVWQRAGVIAAGPAMNLALAVVLLAISAATTGVPVGVSNRIGELMPNMPAMRAGLQSGDAIVAIDGVPVADGAAIVETIHRRPNQDLRLTIERGGRRFEVRVRSVLDAQRQIGLIGFRPVVIYDRMNLWQAVGWGVVTTGRAIAAFLAALAGLILRPRELLRQMMGPVGAVAFLGDPAQGGGELFLYTVASLSTIIGVFNLLPFPGLDGGRLLFLGAEAVRRRPIDPRREGYVHYVGIAILLILLITLTWRDVMRLLGFRT